MSDNVEVSYDFLPDDIVTQILIRLPIKSIITCTSVCKTWKSLIQKSTFHHSINNNHYLLFRKRYPCDKEIKGEYSLHNNYDFTEHTRFDFPLESHNDERKFRLVGTCNSLICLSHKISKYIDELFLWNPCVRKYVKLPSPNGTLLAMGKRAYMGFGFDSKNRDYKVVRLLCHIHMGIPKYQCEVEVYSLCTGEWRMVTVSPPKFVLFGGEKATGSVNGALHWLAFRETDDHNVHRFILVFDLVGEVFQEIVLPEIIHTLDLANISVYGNSIAFLLLKGCLNVGRQIIWVMKEYGVVSSWTKVLTIDDYVPGYAMGFRRNGEVLLSTEEGLYASLDLENQKMKELGISSDGFSLVGSYVESLVLLDMAANGAVTY